MSLGALLFDVDGTLADTEPQGHLPAYNRAFEDFGLDWRWTPELYRRLLRVSGGRERIHHYIEHFDPSLGHHDAAIDDDAAGWVRELHQRKTHHFRSRLERGEIPLRPGVARLIAEAGDAGVPVAIVTNASRPTLEPFLAHALGPALVRHIALCVCGDEVEHKKPAPDLYREACRRLNCAPERCVTVEDSAVGVTAATGAGVASIVTVNDDTRRQRFDDAVLVLDSLGEPGRPAERLRTATDYDFDHVTLALVRAVSDAWQERSSRRG